ncbi:MAG: hypothetical protein QW478_04895 [Candidatus Micrarchaeaceae archaeon]
MEENHFKEEDFSGMKMIIIYNTKDSVTKKKVYNQFKDFNKVFNKMPKKSELKQPVKTSFVSLRKDGQVDNVSLVHTLPTKYSAEDVDTYFKTLKTLLEKVRAKEGHIIQNRNSVTILVQPNDQ